MKMQCKDGQFFRDFPLQVIDGVVWYLIFAEQYTPSECRRGFSSLESTL